MQITKIHHVAYRCKDAKETVEWYTKHLNMNFVLAIAEDEVPSTHAPDPYMHLFMDAGGGNILAFFELPNSPAMGRDANTPDWVQHIALEVDSVDGFQGREKEAVVISLVRSNPQGDVGFLADVRRMNVALTRARRKLLVVGDSATLAAHPFYAEMLSHFESTGAYRTVWEEGPT